MNPDFIFEAAAHVAAWLDSLDGIRLAEDAFRAEGAEPDKKLPACLVYPLSEDPRPNTGSRQEPVQPITSRFGVLHIVPAPNRPAGRGKGKERTMTALRASRMAILKKRVGDGPDGPIPGARGAPVFAGGALEEISNGRIYWIDRYTVEWVLDAQNF